MPENAMKLADFLLAMIAKDEAMARAALEQDIVDDAPARWRDEPLDLVIGMSRVWAGTGQAVVPHAYHHQGAHIARHDPARVLAECEAKRRIVEIHGNGDAWCDYCAGYAEGMQDECHTGRLLALPYADHPDYREEWKP